LPGGESHPIGDISATIVLASTTVRGYHRQARQRRRAWPRPLNGTAHPGDKPTQTATLSDDRPSRRANSPCLNTRSYGPGRRASLTDGAEAVGVLYGEGGGVQSLLRRVELAQHLHVGAGLAEQALDVGERRPSRTRAVLQAGGTGFGSQPHRGGQSPGNSCVAGDGRTEHAEPVRRRPRWSTASGIPPGDYGALAAHAGVDEARTRARQLLQDARREGERLVSEAQQRMADADRHYAEAFNRAVEEGWAVRLLADLGYAVPDRRSKPPRPPIVDPGTVTTGSRSGSGSASAA
jgi:hypothetical protein